MILIDGFEIDVTTSEAHSFDSEVTMHPVESGADISDHVRAQPIVITLEGLVSDTPFGDLASRREGTNPPSSEAFSRMLAIRDRREPVSITTSLRTFDSMALQTLSVPRTPKDGFSLRFTATFVQIQLVTNERTTVQVAVPRAAKKVNRGNVPAVVIGDAVIEEPVPEERKPKTRVSLLKSGSNNLFDWLDL